MQVYCHATCATDTSNVSFVMDSVFDVVLKDNLRRMQKADLSKVAPPTPATPLTQKPRRDPTLRTPRRHPRPLPSSPDRAFALSPRVAEFAS